MLVNKTIFEEFNNEEAITEKEIYDGIIVCYCAPYFKVVYYDGDWEDCDCNQVEKGRQKYLKWLSKQSKKIKKFFVSQHK
jgi:hypothetical protein